MIDVSSSKPLLAVAGICTWTAVLISIHQVGRKDPKRRPETRGGKRERTRRKKNARKKAIDVFFFFPTSLFDASRHSIKKKIPPRPPKKKTQRQIVQHLRHYTEPLFQRYIVRIVFMVPFYSATSFFSLLFPVAAPYLDTVRDCYEVRRCFLFSLSFSTTSFSRFFPFETHRSLLSPFLHFSISSLSS